MSDNPAPNKTARAALKIAKFLSPKIFENKTPNFHIELLNFVFGEGKRKAAAVFRGAGKSTLLNKIFAFARIFFFREPFILIVSENEKKAKSFLREIKRMIDLAELARLDIKRGDVWNEEDVEVISNGKICHIAALGRGQDPRGALRDSSRPTLMILDDIENRALLLSKEQREKLSEWLQSDLYPCLHPDGEILFMGTIINEDSELNRAIKSGAWDVFVKPIIENGRSAWASRFPLETLNAMKDELYKNGLHHVWYNEYLCLPRSAEKVLFKPELFKYFKRVEFAPETEKVILKNARDRDEIITRKPIAIIKDDEERLPIENLRVYAAMDLASAKGKDRSAIVVCGIDGAKNIYVLGVYCGFWNPHEKSVAVLRANGEFKPLRFGIEQGNALNDFFYTVDVAQQETKIRVPIEPLKAHGRNKQTRIAALHSWFMTGRVYFNRADPNCSLLEAQLTAFDEAAEGAEDDLPDAFAYILDFIVGRNTSAGRLAESEEGLWN
ncbi:MAG: hypothetical protein LBU73_06780 [Helicobacteraceae bacterium]|jgi:predicted phage terminase large subunit-like protein|nr:hypothetical protein [Helicobacteraceae bacterium]